MIRRLVLMRHAKSSWDNPALRDHDRPLNRRGIDAAQRLGHWLRAKGYVPDQILCSSAVRTVETCERLGLDVGFTLIAGLYHADPEAMWGQLRRASGRCVLMLGHNPGIGEFAAEIVAGPVKHPRFDDFPTAATLVVDFDAPDWLAAGPGQGRLVSFVVPRDLAGESD